MGNSGCKDKEEIQREQEVGEKRGNFICVKDWFNNLGLHSGDSMVTGLAANFLQPRFHCRLLFCYNSQN